MDEALPKNHDHHHAANTRREGDKVKVSKVAFSKMKVLFLVSAAVYLVGLAAGHTYFTPLDFLRHERAQVKLGETIHACSYSAIERKPTYYKLQTCSTNQEPTSGNHQTEASLYITYPQLKTKHSAKRS